MDLALHRLSLQRQQNRQRRYLSKDLQTTNNVTDTDYLSHRHPATATAKRCSALRPTTPTRDSSATPPG
jgi:hypothetical protein